MSGDLDAFIREVGSRRNLTAAEERDLARRAHAGDTRARDKMVEHNVRLVISIVKKYARMGFELEDLIQEGTIGLVKAVDRFDPDRGFRFTTYATWWIKQATFRYMNGIGGATIRVPGKVKHDRRILEKHVREKGGTLEDAAAELDISPEDFHDAYQGPRIVASLDQPQHDDDAGGSRHESIPDTHAADPAEDLADDSWVREQMDTLPELEKRVLELRWGFDGFMMTHREVAERLGIRVKASQESQRSAIAKLRRARALADSDENGTDPVMEVLSSLEEPRDPEAPTCARKVVV